MYIEETLFYLIEPLHVKEQEQTDPPPTKHTPHWNNLPTNNSISTLLTTFIQFYYYYSTHKHYNIINNKPRAIKQ